MRYTILLILLGLVLCGDGASADTRIAPDWTLQTPDGERVTLSEVAAEQPVLVLFWATWCPYCKALMPHLQSSLHEYGDAIRVVAVHFHDDDGDPVAFIDGTGYDFTFLVDGDDVAGLNGIHGTPGLLLVDRDLSVRFDLQAMPPLPRTSKGNRGNLLAAYWAAGLRDSLDRIVPR